MDSLVDLNLSFTSLLYVQTAATNLIGRYVTIVIYNSRVVPDKKFTLCGYYALLSLNLRLSHDMNPGRHIKRLGKYVLI